ncbi:MAG: anion permease [Actinobacteria bacterium]|nr:anion permease [Actinomycetota bacterium]
MVTQNTELEASGTPAPRSALTRWAIVAIPILAIIVLPAPPAITPPAWRMLGIFTATIVGVIVQPVPMGAVVLTGLTAAVFTGVVTIEKALGGWANPLVWLVFTAFLMSRGMIKTGLGRRIALIFIRAIGQSPLGLGYALLATDVVLATFIPSNGARCGGIIFPIAVSLTEAYGSKPGPTARRLGAFLMTVVYQGDVIIAAMFLTGQASNVLMADLARKVAGVEITYARWALAGIVPGLVSLVAVPFLLRRMLPPEISDTRAAPAMAAAELERLGPMQPPEKLMLAVFALLGISVLLVSGVLTWQDVLSERAAWDVFIWYGGLIKMAETLNDYGLTRLFAESTSGLTAGWPWWTALAVLLIVYFYAHYAFASITAHASAMYMPFLAVAVAAGAPPFLAAFSFATFSCLDASLTHYGTTPAPIYFGAGYVSQATWWRVGFVVSLVTILVWAIAGAGWWRLLGLW